MRRGTLSIRPSVQETPFSEENWEKKSFKGQGHNLDRFLVDVQISSQLKKNLDCCK